MENIDIAVQITIALRIMMAVVLSFILGIERELTGKIAGLRTHILVCVGACVFTILSIFSFKMHVMPGVVGVNDPARIAAQVITGIGFIGAGTVMRHGTNVFGITTAATLWVCAAIGMACGCGEFVTATIALLATLFVLITVRQLEKKVLSKRKKSYKEYEITMSASINECDFIENIFENNFKKIYKFNKKLLNNDELRFVASISTKKTMKELNDIFNQIQNVKSIEIRECYE